MERLSIENGVAGLTVPFVILKILYFVSEKKIEDINDDNMYINSPKKGNAKLILISYCSLLSRIN